MELVDLKNYVEGADASEAKAFAFMAQWLQEMSPKYCTCSVQCNKDCAVVRGMGEAFQAAMSKL